MKLIIAIVHDRVKQKLSDALVAEGIAHTQLGSSGGFLRQGNATLLIGVEDDRVQAILAIVRQKCQTKETFRPVGAELSQAQIGAFGSVISESAGGAVAFVLNIEETHRI